MLGTVHQHRRRLPLRRELTATPRRRARRRAGTARRRRPPARVARRPRPRPRSGRRARRAPASCRRACAAPPGRRWRSPRGAARPRRPARRRSGRRGRFASARGRAGGRGSRRPRRPRSSSLERTRKRSSSAAIGPPSGPLVGPAVPPPDGVAGVSCTCQRRARVRRSQAHTPSLPVTAIVEPLSTGAELRSRPCVSPGCTSSCQRTRPLRSESSTSALAPGTGCGGGT